VSFPKPSQCRSRRTTASTYRRFLPSKSAFFGSGPSGLVATQEFCTRISALKFQWVSRCKFQLQKWARYSMPGRGSRCFSLVLTSREKAASRQPGGLRLYFFLTEGRLPRFSAKYRRKCFRAFSIVSGRNLKRYARFGESARPRSMASMGANQAFETRFCPRHRRIGNVKFRPSHEAGSRWSEIRLK